LDRNGDFSPGGARPATTLGGAVCLVLRAKKVGTKETASLTDSTALVGGEPGSLATELALETEEMEDERGVSRLERKVWGGRSSWVGETTMVELAGLDLRCGALRERKLFGKGMW